MENPAEMALVEDIQRIVWPGSEASIVPIHMLIAAIHGGGIVAGVFDHDKIIGFVFGFPGFYLTPDGPRLKHCSHMLGVHPDYRDSGIGFRLKRAQWQMVRHQGIDRITWTFDPLGSRNAHLNITKLGAVCNTYIRDCYGRMEDHLNQGLPSDRFEVDWWVNSRRVNHRLGKHPRRRVTLEDFHKAEAYILPALSPLSAGRSTSTPFVLVEIPANFAALRAENLELSLEWRMHTRAVFETLFKQGYLVTDFIHTDESPASFYVLSHGEATL